VVRRADDRQREHPVRLDRRARACYDLSKPENSESGDSWFGLGPPLVIGVGFLVLGAILMVLWRIAHKEFFRRKREVVGAPRAGPTVTE
jgi:hypothetical protein